MNKLTNLSDPVAIAESARKARITCARNDVNTFLELVLKDEVTGRAVEQADCHVEWHEACDRHDRVILYSHIESGKTQQISIGRTLFELGKKPNLRIALVSATERLGQKNLGLIAHYIESSEELHAIFPKLVPGEPWTATSITVKSDIHKRDPSVQILGVHGGILGARLDLIILDDILTYENTLTPHRRQDTWNWYHSTLAGRLTANGRVIAIGTAWHPEDLLHRLAAQPRWYCMRYPVEDSVGAPMWPLRWPKDRIDVKRTELGPLEFARQMLCQARDDAEARFQKTWIDQCLEAGDKCQPATSALDFFRKHPKLAPPAWFSENNPELADAMDVLNRMEVGIAGRFLTGVDLAVQRHSAADETVIFTIYAHTDGRRQPAEVLAGKWTGPEIVRNILSAIKRFGSMALVENNAAQHFILQFAIEIGGVVPIFPFTTGKNKVNPVYGVESLAAEFANAHWLIPSKGGVAICPQMQKWIQEMLFYDPNGHTGDRLMASWFCRELARRVSAKVTRIGSKVVG
jgi:hypothetical protein